MAEYVIKMADERGHVLEQLENGGSEGEVRERYAQRGFYVYSVKPKGLLSTELRRPSVARSSRTSSSSSTSSS
jgi:hypothetical protein